MDSTTRLVGDIGGTHARFGLQRDRGAPIEDVRGYRCADFPGLAAAARRYLEETAARPAEAAFALACAIVGERVTLTNSRWVVDAQALADQLSLARVCLLNDFEALALALPHLKDADLTPIDGALSVARNAALPMVVIGPGTGLGVATCVPGGDGRWIALPGEGGHATLAAADDFESEVLRLMRADGHVSAERALSGIGLPGLHRAVCVARGGSAPERLLSPEQIVASADDDKHCAATLDLFAAMLGGFAGNVALTVGARGGVFIAGGIAQRLADRLARSRFRARFEDKGRFRAYLAPIATLLIRAPHAALDGAAHALHAASRAAR
jgi:glucokinase